MMLQYPQIRFFLTSCSMYYMCKFVVNTLKFKKKIVLTLFLNKVLLWLQYLSNINKISFAFLSVNVMYSIHCKCLLVYTLLFPYSKKTQRLIFYQVSISFSLTRRQASIIHFTNINGILQHSKHFTMCILYKKGKSWKYNVKMPFWNRQVVRVTQKRPTVWHYAFSYVRTASTPSKVKVCE